MTCRSSRRFGMLLAVFLSLSLALSAEVCLTDAEAEELDRNLTQLETTLIQQEQQTEQLQTELAGVKNLLAISYREIESAKVSYYAAETYWKKRNIETAILFSSAGVGLGFLLGWLFGGR